MNYLRVWRLIYLIGSAKQIKNRVLELQICNTIFLK